MRLDQIAIGDRVRLVNTDDGSECVAVLKRGGTMGGAAFDHFFAFEGDIADVPDADELPELRTCAEDCEAAEISI